MFEATYDLAVIGGGLSGAAVARDAAGRGLSVFLAEAMDLGEGGSSATGSLLTRPLDHLNPLAFRPLAADAAEADVVHRSAPHLVQPIELLLPYHARLWPRWALRLGLAAVDRGRRGTSFGPTRRVDLAAGGARGPTGRHFTVAYAVADGLVDDSRLAVLHAVDARNRGATIRPHVRCVVAERDGKRWRLSLEGLEGTARFTVLARVLVNAAGAAVAHVNDHVIHTDRRLPVPIVKHAFIVVRRPLPDGIGYALPHAAGAVVSVTPVGAGHALIGPRVVPLAGGGEAAIFDAADVRSLLDAANQYFDAPLAEDDIVSGLATAAVDPRAGGKLELDASDRTAPLVSVVGATLANHRRLAEAAVSAAAPFVTVGPAWTAGAALPGGGFPAGGVGEIARVLAAAYRFIPAATALRLARAYGTRAQEILTGGRAPIDLGRRFGADLYEVEVHYLRREEWAETAADILWRRSKLGFQFSAAEAVALDLYLKRTHVAPPGPVIP